MPFDDERLATLKLVVLLVGLGLCKFASANLMLILNDDGQLLGADNLDVAGVLYDVRFFEGSCTDIYRNCGNTNAPFNFAFENDANKALIAANSLALQVFVDGSEGMFDSQPELLFGCSSLGLCRVYIPFDLDFSVNVVTFFNGSSSNDIYE